MPSFLEAVHDRLWPGSLMETLGFRIVEASDASVVGEVSYKAGLEQIKAQASFTEAS